MHPIVQLTQLGELRASSEAIAQGFKLQHKNVLELVRRHLLRLEVFGKVAFETRLNRRGSATETALLNEQQASLLIAMMRNTDEVLDFKVALIGEFFRMRSALEQRDMGLWQQRMALEFKDANSLAMASFGSSLMTERKKALPVIKRERNFLDAEMQPGLLN